MAPAAPKKATTVKKASSGKTTSSTSASARFTKAKPSSTINADKPATVGASMSATPSPALTKKKSVRVAAEDKQDTPNTAAKKQTKAKADKALDAAAEPKKRLPSKAAAKKQAQVTEKEVSREAVEKSKPAAAAKSNGKKRARDVGEDEDREDATDEVVVPAVSKKVATSKAKNAKAVKAVAEKPVEAGAESDAGSEKALDEAEIIKGFSDVSGSDDDADSSDEDDDEDDVAASKNAPILTVKLPNAKDDKSVKQRLDKVAKRKEANKTTDVPATLYIGRLPRGFLEDQLRAYFAQFGDVRRLRVSRNRKTGKPKHYAFIEFADKDVAKIVQETMNNYLIDGHLLQVREVPKDKIHPKLWIGANRTYRPVPVDRLERVRRDQPKTKEQQAKHNNRILKRQEARRQNIKAAGIDYEFEGHKVEA